MGANDLDELQRIMDELRGKEKQIGGKPYTIRKDGRLRIIRLIRLRAWLAHPGLWIPR